jgi:Protein of unknown function (DUF2590)
MIDHIDLLIENDEIKLDADGLPVMCSGVVSIGQDVIHAIRESGLAYQMIANRSSESRRTIETDIKLIVENDERIIPGTVEIIQSGTEGVFTIMAMTTEGELKEDL